MALEGSRGLARDEDSNFYWIGTLEIYLYTGPKSGEGTFAQGGGIVSKQLCVRQIPMDTMRVHSIALLLFEVDFQVPRV